jgi:arginyl-tRNA synthetase
MENTIQLIVQQLYGQAVETKLTRPDPQYGDYATNVALQLARPLGRNPREVAEEISEALRLTGDFSEVTVAGPGFINVRVAAVSLAQTLQAGWSPSYGENSDGAGKTVIVEYPSPNMAKPYSVGHLRTGNQGWAARQLMKASGWNVITDNHLGDYGAPLGIWITGFRLFSSDEALEKNGVYELGRVYIATKKALKEELERAETSLADEVQNWLLKYEAGDEEAVRYSALFNEISLKHIHNVMDRLKISTDYELGEAFFAPQGKQAVQTLLASNVAVQNDDGSIIVPLDEYGFDVPLLVQKSNGSALYATTDLATMLYREREWSPDKVIHAVGAEQIFYFSQLFAMAKKLGINTELIHLWFGTIDQLSEDGVREKMSSRKGVVLMEELLDQAEEKARAVVKGRDISDEDIKKVALGAIKFSDFMSDRRTNILFDWNTIFALTGFSGPYVQYAAVRVNAILRDNGNGQVFVEHYSYETEKNLISQLLEYPEIVRRAAEELEPHRIAAFVYELARELNRYYEATPVATGEVSETEKSARLGVLTKVSQIFTHALDLFGIEVPERM